MIVHSKTDVGIKFDSGFFISKTGDAEGEIYFCSRVILQTFINHEGVIDICR
jgi:hypothetical protein